MDYIVALAPMLYFQELQGADKQCLGTHKLKDAARFSTKLEALEFCRANNLSASARVVLLPVEETR